MITIISIAIIALDHILWSAVVRRLNKEHQRRMDLLRDCVIDIYRTSATICETEPKAAATLLRMQADTMESETTDSAVELTKSIINKK